LKLVQMVLLPMTPAWHAVISGRWVHNVLLSLGVSMYLILIREPACYCRRAPIIWIDEYL
jgi:hypothetical protein